MYIINKDGSVTRTISYEEDQKKLFKTRLNLIQKQSLERGEEMGLKKGLEQGEEKNKKETAFKMLMDGLSLDMIQKYTSLSEKEIQKLQK